MERHPTVVTGKAGYHKDSQLSPAVVIGSLKVQSKCVAKGSSAENDMVTADVYVDGQTVQSGGDRPGDDG